MVCYLLAMTNGVYEEIAKLCSGRKRAVLAIIIAHTGATPRKDSAKMLVREDGSQTGSIGGGSIEAEVCREALQVMESGKPKLLSFDLSGIDHDERALVCGGTMQVYLEPIVPDPILMMFGAGHVSRAVAEAAALIGFRLIVYDDREKYATVERFPAAEVVLVKNWDDALRKVSIDKSTFVFIATQRPRTDRLCLRAAVLSSAKYVGMLGSLKKTRTLMEGLRKEGVENHRLERVLVPAGFDIGSETPEEIAASVVAELVAVRKNLDIRRLRDSLRTVNNPPDVSG